MKLLRRPEVSTGFLLSCLCLSIVCAVAAVYANSLRNPFIFDDGVVLSRIPRDTQLWPLPINSRWLVDVSFRLNYLISGANPAGFRIVNVAIHALATLALFGLVLETAALPRFSGCFGNSGVWLAWVSALAWGLHPYHVQSVAYVCQRYESAMGLSLFVCLWCFARGARSPRPRLWFDLSVVAAIAGMGAKEVMVAAPGLALIYDYVFVCETPGEIWKRRKAVHAALAACWALVFVLWIGAEAERMERGEAGVERPERFAYLLTQSSVIVRYIVNAFVPGGLCFDYGWEVASSWTEALLPAATVWLLVIVSVYLVFRRSASGFLGAAFFLILAPTSSVLPLEDPAFDHRMYAPLASIAVGLVFGVYRMIKVVAGGRMGKVLMFVAVCMIVFLGMLTVQRNRIFSSELSLWTDVVSKRPGNLRARNELAIALSESGRLDEAKMELSRVLDATASVEPWHPEWPAKPLPANSMRANRFRALANMAVSLEREGKFESALEYYTEALRIVPFSEQVRDMMRKALKAMEAGERQRSGSGDGERETRSESERNALR